MYTKSILTIITILLATSFRDKAQGQHSQSDPVLSGLIYFVEPLTRVYEGEKYITFSYTINNTTPNTLYACVVGSVDLIYDIKNKTYLQNKDLSGYNMINEGRDCQMGGKEIKPGDSLAVGTTFLDNFYILKPGRYLCVVRCPFIGGYAEKSIPFQVMQKKEPDYSIYQAAIEQTKKGGYKDLKTNPFYRFLKEQQTNVYYNTALINAVRDGFLNLNLTQNTGDIISKTKYEMMKDPEMQDYIIKYSNHTTLDQICMTIARKFPESQTTLFKNETEMYTFYNVFLKKLENRHPYYSRVLLSHFPKTAQGKSTVDVTKLKNFAEIKNKKQQTK